MAFSKCLFRSLIQRSGSLCHRGQIVSCRSFGQPAAQTHPHLIQNGEVTPGITKDEFFHRRQRLMEMVQRASQSYNGKRHIVIIPSAPKVFMTHDIPYNFRQNTDFLYLCGFMEPNSVLILESNTESSLPDHTSILFVPKRDPSKELWEGARSGIDGAVELTGVDRAFNTENIDSYLSKFLKNSGSFMTWYDFRKPAHHEYHNKYLADFLKENKYGFVRSPRQLIQSLRAIKSEAEIELMEKSCQVASESFVEVMKYSKPEINESQLFAKMDFECRIRGAEYLAYPPVVAGGNRANTIHYVSNNQLIDSGDLVLMDAGCEYHGYTSDITRTWPISGEFTAAQRDIYEAVLEVQKDCINLCSANLSIEMIFHEMLILISKQLHRLGIAEDSSQGIAQQRLAREFCPHHVGHYLGMDVHDTDEVSRSINLKPGMIITIEPGIYIPETRQDVPRDLRGNGIRIEDDILITKDGAKNLTAAAPKCPDDIEKLMRIK